MNLEVQFAQIDWAGQRMRIEHQWLEPAGAAAPRRLIVFLHEGLGSLSMWKDFPQRLCDAAHCRGLVYSRPGHGRSTPSAALADFAPGYMHEHAHGFMPALLDALRIDNTAQALWLFGHSDGASIALLYAARFAQPMAGAVLLAPHIVVEDLSVASIAAARTAFLESDLPERLAKYHDDAASMFWRWNRIWLAPEFRPWNITAELASIRAPLLAVQGLQDEYGTLEQIRAISRLVANTELLELPDCRHSAHRDQPEKLIAAAASFIHSHTPGDTP